MKKKTQNKKRTLLKSSAKVETYAAALDKHAIVASTDAKGKINYVNDLFCDVSGYSKEELIGQDHRIINSGHHSKEFFADMWQTILSGESWHGQIKNKAKNGEYYWVDTIITPAMNAKGDVEELISIRLLITDQKENEERLKEMTERLSESLLFLKSIQDNAAYAIISGAPDGTITSFNKKAEEMLGYSAEELVGKETPAIWHDIDEVVARSQEFSEKLDEKIEPGFDTFVCHSRLGLANEFEWTYIHKNGERFPVNLSITQLKDQHGNMTGYLGIAQDISEKKALQASLEEQKAIAYHRAKLASIGELAAGVGHEINNPLAIMMMYLTSIRKKLEETAGDDLAEVRTTLAKAEAAGGRIAEIVKGLRTFSYADTAQVSEFPVSEIVLETFNLIHDIFAQEGVSLSCDIRLSEPEQKKVLIAANIGKFQQVLMNLLTNARDATEGSEGRTVSLLIERTETLGSLRITVADNGKGIPQDIQQKIFDPFFTTKGMKKGTGIGLSLVHNFVHEMHGTIDIDSTEGKGTKMIVELPIVGECQQSDDQTAADSGQGSQLSGRVLLVEDETEIREMMEELLEHFGVTVTAVESGQAALEYLNEHPDQIDLIVSDVKMPVLGGIDMLKQIRESSDIRQPKFVFMTGGVNQDLEKMAKSSGLTIDGFLYKPFGESELRNLLVSCLADASGKRAA